MYNKNTCYLFAKPQAFFACTSQEHHTCNGTWTHNHLVHKQILIYELNGCGFKSCCSHLNLRFQACFKQGVPWHSGNHRVWIHSEMHMWHDRNIQSTPYLFYLPTLWGSAGSVIDYCCLKFNSGISPCLGKNLTLESFQFFLLVVFW